MKTKFTLFLAFALLSLSNVIAQSSQINASMQALGGYVSGASIEIPLELTFPVNDGEYADFLELTFPLAVTIIDVSNSDVFHENNNPTLPDEAFNGVNGQSVSWGDNNNDGNGGIIAFSNSGQATYTFSITIIVAAGTTGDLTVDFFVSGDTFGQNPGDFNGTFTLSEISVELPLDFELPIGQYGITGFGGAENTSVISNPDPSGINTSENVWQQTQDPAFSELFAGAVINLSDPVDFSESGLVAMDVWTPQNSTTVTLRFEVANNEPASSGMERTVSTSVTGAWETLVFNFAGDAQIGNEFVRCVVFFNLDESNTNDTFYADNVRIQPAVELPLNFELPVEQYSLIGFGGAENTGIITNPDASGVNTSANVWQQTQDAAFPELFAGAVIDLSAPVDFSESGAVAMDVWTPQDVTEVTIRFEVANNEPASSGMERTVNTSATGAWETLLFDFSADGNIGNDFVRCVVFFNLGLANTNTTFYADNIRLQAMTNVDNFASIDDIKVFPNPTNNQFTLDLELNASERVTVDLVNIVGQVVKSVDLGNRSVGLNREYIDVNDLSEGIYFMNLNVGGTRGTVKVQVVR